MSGFGRPRRHADHWRWIGGPVPPHADAITLGSLIIARRRVADAIGFDGLMRHEYEHVQQWRELGALRFVGAYVGSYLRWRWHGHSHVGAYRRIPLEVRARHAARGVVPPGVSARTDASGLPTGSIGMSLPPASR